jgi:hypothetical protein
LPVEQAFFAPNGVCGRADGWSWSDQAVNRRHRGLTAPFFSAVDGSVEPLSFCLWLNRGQLKRVVEFAHHQEAAVRTDLRTPEFQPHVRVEIHPICPLRTSTLWVKHESHPSMPPTP